MDLEHEEVVMLLMCRYSVIAHDREQFNARSNDTRVEQTLLNEYSAKLNSIIIVNHDFNELN